MVFSALKLQLLKLALLLMLLSLPKPYSAVPQQQFLKNRLHTESTKTVKWYQTTTIKQIKISLSTGTVNNEFFQKVETLITSLKLITTTYFTKVVVSIQTALNYIKERDSMINNVYDNYTSTDDIQEIQFSPLPTQFLAANAYQILTTLKNAKKVEDNSETKNLAENIELQLTQMQQLIQQQISLYNLIIEGKMPYNQITSVVQNTINTTEFDTIASEFISSGNYNGKIYSYYTLYGFADAIQVEKIFVANYGNFNLQYPTFIKNINGYIFTSPLPKSLATAIQVYSDLEISQIFNDDPEKLLNTLLFENPETKVPEPFFYTKKGSVIFNNENSKIEHDFGKYENYSPIISTFAKKIIKIGKNTMKFILNLTGDENNVVNFNTDQYILDHLARIFNFDMEYLLLLLILPVILIITGIIIMSYKFAKKVKIRKERKQREKKDYRTINMIFRRKPED